MDGPNERLMKSIFDKDLNVITLNNDIHINKICRNGMTLIGAAAQTGNLPLLKLLVDFHQSKSAPLNSIENRNKPQFLQLEIGSPKRCKNIGYFVVTREEENEFGDGPTPEGMEGLEWDLEVNDANNFNTEPEPVEDSTIDLYRWYANILNRTAVVLESPEQDFSRLDQHGQSILHYSVMSGSVEMMEYLLDNFGRELSINQSDKNGFNCLHKAVLSGDMDMVRFLIRKGVNVNAFAGRHRTTPLHIAAKLDLHSILRFLIESGANVNALDSEDRTALNWAVREGDEESVRILCEAGSLVNNEEPGEILPLDLAVYNGNAAVVKLLLKHGARIIPSHHLLHKAISRNNLDVAMALIDGGAMINGRDSNGFTPIMTACSRKNALILQYLIYKGADVNIHNPIDGRTALHVCSQDVRSENNVNRLISILVNSGANMNASSYQGTVLLHAIVLGNVYAAMALIRHGADVNIKDDRVCCDVLSVSQRYGTSELCKATVYAGFHMKDMSHDPKKLRKGPNDDTFDFILHAKINPLNLREICRIVIRKKIGSDRLLSKIRTLPLPTMLHQYLSLEILE
ncbi:serine/threonine-protein phosphatase 6 regulatory ankyrin repeat subunit A-like [Anthonomus grandis grandis]|uniref:serine/threonine-protein phosphatase 6 regulatory ankyrin repeat subunit A-like n=1 Tax=Anthonomus grandis grandis TaxID=2921223 RepID=UPI0021657AA5|nr:serine/threonine-protein phosphatase 6 regulatory ankyrin repeat subunit A-like [Anthonomus grandis grandis]